MMKTTLALTALLASVLVAPVATAGQMREVPVVTQNMRAGELIRESDVTYRRVDISRLHGTLILDKDQLIGREAARTLVQGVPLRTDYVRVPPAARRGEEVTLRFAVRGLTLETSGRVLEDGQVGDTVRVMNNHSNAVISGTVLESGVVTVN